MGSVVASVATGISASGALVPGSPAAALLTAPFGPGRRGAVVTVDAMLTDGARRATSKPRVFVTIGGVRMSSFPGEDAAAGAVHATFRLDLDAAERSSPGTFIGRPLDIKLFGFDGSGAGFRAGVIVLRARMEKKAARIATVRARLFTEAAGLV